MNGLQRLAALSVAIAIAMGAFAAHAAGPRAAELLRTGALYQMVHGVAVIALRRPAHDAAAALLLGGSAVFAVSIYALAFGAPGLLGAITPIGGLAMIAGWVWVAVRR